jgi:two-component system LytT family response regulator
MTFLDGQHAPPGQAATDDSVTAGAEPRRALSLTLAGDALLTSRLAVLFADPGVRATVHRALDATLLEQAPHADAIVLALRSRAAPSPELIAALRAGSTPFALASANVEHAITAFDVGARDFLRLPADRLRASRCLARLALAAGTLPPPRPQLACAERDGLRMVDVAAITYVSGDRNYAWLHGDGGGVRVRERLAALEQALAPQGFARVHRSLPVNLHRVRRLTRARDRWYVELDPHLRLPCSRDRVAELRTWLPRPLGGRRGGRAASGCNGGP